MSESDESPQTENRDDIEPETSALTRRQWILRLGEAAVLAGFSGRAAEALMSPERLKAPETVASSTLPPGLYDPSGEHMAHVLFRDERFITPPPGSETEYAVAHAGVFEPAFFLPEEFKAARRLVGLMLNTPADAGTSAGLGRVDDETVDSIVEWMDLVLSQAAATREAAKNLSAQHRELAIHYHGEEGLRRLETAGPEKTWRDGLAWLDQESRKLSGQGFPNLTEAQQLELLGSISEANSSAQNRSGGERTEAPGTQLYPLLKTDTIRGYYTSRAGLKELDYQGNAFHPESPGCPNK
jgi:Gluconate 2-dehydrogenase subunit 3